MLFNEKYTDLIGFANTCLEKYLPEEKGLPVTFYSAMNYSMRAGGKRIRPILIYLTYDLLGGRENRVVEPFMAALEMIHTHSLIHDDLPALDNDDYRRGRKTNHIVYGEAMAILAGDGLLNLAYETAVRSFGAAPGDPCVPAALTILACKTGKNGMLAGQSLDVELDGHPLTTEQLDYIYRNKTGALLSAALMIGGALAGAGEPVLEKLELVGELAGVAFQIKDDILDVVGDEAVLGKPIGSDQKNEKTTYVTLYGMEKAKQAVQDLTEQALSVLDEVIPAPNRLRDLLSDLIERNN